MTGVLAAAGIIALGVGTRVHSQDATKADEKKPEAAKADEKKAEECAACKTPANDKIHEFHLYTIDKDWEFADGKKTYVMGYANWDDNFSKAPEPVDKKKLSDRLTVPSPTIRVRVGEHVRVTLHNTGNCCAPKDSGFNGVTHTIHFHGLDLLQPVDGVPDLPKPGVAEGGEYAYDFVPEFEGTYTYHCHVDSATHILLGMYGLVIVDPAEGTNTAYGYHYDREYSLCLSEWTPSTTTRSARRVAMTCSSGTPTTSS